MIISSSSSSSSSRARSKILHTGIPSGGSQVILLYDIFSDNNFMICVLLEIPLRGILVQMKFYELYITPNNNSLCSNKFIWQGNPFRGISSRKHVANILPYLPRLAPGVIVDLAAFDCRGKILHTRNHKSELTLENATENPLGNSSENPLDKWQSFGKYHWQVKSCWKIPLNIHWKMPLEIHDDFWGVDFWCAICCP